MSTLKATRGAQEILAARFDFNFDDTMVPAAGGAAVDFGKTNTASTVFEVINLPKGAVIVGGDVVTETAFDAATYNISVGDSGSATRYLGATDKAAAGRTALVPTGFVSAGENLRITVVPADACTTGKAHVTVHSVIDGRETTVSPN